MIDPILLVLLIAGVFVFIQGITLSISWNKTRYSDIIKKQVEIINEIQLDMKRLLNDNKRV